MAMPSELLKVSNLQSINVVEMFLADDLDTTEFDRLNDGIADVFRDEPGGRWLLDLAKVNYMGSAVLGLMVNIRHRVKGMGGRLALCNMSPRLHGIFKACCLERLFTIARTRDDGLRYLR
ncbi:MAG TPA: STAS domain-containing protein [Tepidisphaeraceae bacterium]|jgi:anti-anti-sigma factor